MLRFAHEMNGNWYPWSEGVNGNAAGQYVPAYRRVVTLFRSVGVTNVTWVWSPKVASPPAHGESPFS
jgi:beta-mannanase